MTLPYRRESAWPTVLVAKPIFPEQHAFPIGFRAAAVLTSMTDSTLTSPLDRLVWDTVAGATGTYTLDDLCTYLATTSRYTDYTVRRSVLEQVEQGDLVMVGNMVLTPEE